MKFSVLGNAKVLAILAFLIIVAAAYIRLYDLGGRSLWLDEAWLANAVSEDSLRGVIASSKSAPPLFATVVHYIISWLKNNEFTLRLLPCGFGIGSIILIFFLTRKLSNAKAALLALIPFAFAPELVYYAKELKQYSGDMFFAILLVFLAERIIHRHSFKNWILFVVLASVGLWFSHPLTFVVPGVALVLLYHSFTSGKDKTILKQWFTAHLVIGIAWLVLFFLIVQHQITDFLVAFWQAQYPRASSPRSLLFWFVRSHLNILDFGFRSNAWLALILIPIGLNEFFRKKCKRFLVYALLPLLLALIASFLHRYPYGGVRVMLFAFPLLFIAFGQGLFWTLSTLYRKRYFAAVLIVALLIGWPAASEIYNNLTKPVRRPEMRPVVDYLGQNLKSDDQIYVYYGAKPAFKYYYQGNYKNVTLGESHRDDITRYVPEIDKSLERSKRIWIVFSHYWRNEKRFFLNYLSKRGALLDSFEVTGAFTYLYEIHTLLGFLEGFHRYSQVVSLAPLDKGWLLRSRVCSGPSEGDEYAKNPYVRLVDSGDQEIVRLVVHQGRIGEKDASAVYENSILVSSLPSNYKIYLGYEYGYESKSRESSEKPRFREFHPDFGHRLLGYPLGDWSLEFFYQKLPPTHFAEYRQVVALFKSKEKKILWSRIFGGELTAGDDYVEDPYVRILDSQGNEITKLLVHKGTVGRIGSVLGPRENSLILSSLPSEYEVRIGYQFYYDASHKGEAGDPLELKVEAPGSESDNPGKIQRGLSEKTASPAKDRRFYKIIVG